MTSLSRVLAFAEGHSVLAAVVTVAVLAAVVLAVRGARALVRGHQAADVLTMVSAAVATMVALTGMWRFFGSVLHFSGPDRVATFAFLELAMATSAFRARRNIRVSESHTAGVDGAAVWVLSGLSAVLSSLAARSAAEAVLRLAAPLVAAWLWERGLSLYRRDFTGHHQAIHWRVTPERILVRLGLAEPTGRSTGEASAQRRLAQLALAAKRARMLRATGAAPWRQRWAVRRLDAAMTRAVEYAGLASDTARQDALLAQMGALYGAAELATLTPAAPWQERLALAAARPAEDTGPAADAPAGPAGDSAGIATADEIPPAPAAAAETPVTAGTGGGERRLSKKEQAARLLAAAPAMPETQLAGWLASQLGCTERYGRQLRLELAPVNGSGPGPHDR
jgi:hypothetical protein